MRDASVGFQCPDCVKEGARQTRQGRTAYGGKRSADPRQTTLALIGLNALVWIAIAASGGYRSSLADLLALQPRGYCVLPDGSAAGVDELVCLGVRGSWAPGVSDGAYWQLLTSAFTHIEIWHIAVNMFSLWLLGPIVESVLGRARFLALYVGSALTASATVYWLSAPYGSTVGASGAIFGLLGALLVFAHKVGGNVQQILVVLGINIVITFSYARISWQGHLGGLVGGLVIAAILAYAPRQHRTTWQAVGIGLVMALTLVAIVLRTAALV
jgi:membrane associated rhomboid family serine protease